MLGGVVADFEEGRYCRGREGLRRPTMRRSSSPPLSQLSCWRKVRRQGREQLRWQSNQGQESLRPMLERGGISRRRRQRRGARRRRRTKSESRQLSSTRPDNWSVFSTYRTTDARL